jgi:hypothetical protein
MAARGSVHGLGRDRCWHHGGGDPPESHRVHNIERVQLRFAISNSGRHIGRDWGRGGNSLYRRLVVTSR